ncbi:MAG: acetate--CoA ligase family protein [Chloroflexota bacterium]|nr:acetate--CoA ligase family protein [Chloroflexota bacterium]
MSGPIPAHRLAPLFSARSIAVVGASEQGYGAGPGNALRAIGYDGRWYPVNPKRLEVQGVRCYPDVADIPERIDLAVIVVGRDRVPATLAACAERGARAAVVVSAGFAESGERGAQLQRELSRVARDRGVLVVGPNCFGVASLVTRSAGFTGHGLGSARRGSVAVLSNSGGLLNEVISYGNARGIAFSHLASTGNEAGVTGADVLDFYVDDPATEVVLAILETVRDPRLFVEVADRARTAGKPIVVLKIGSSEKAARAALTHTGALAGSDAVYSALFRQKGILRVRDLDELVEVGALLSGASPVLRRRRLERAAIVEISGGGKGLACDAAAAAGLELPDLSPAVASALDGFVAPGARIENPLDTGLTWGGADMERLYPRALDALASEDAIDVVVSRFTIPADGPLGPIRARVDEMIAAREAHPDRLFVVLSRTCDRFSDEWRRVLADDRVLFVQGYGRGLASLGALARYSRHLRRGAEPAGVASVGIAREVVVPDRSGALDEIASKDLLRGAGLPVLPTALAVSADDAVRLARGYGHPVALKVVSPEIVHKSDSGGVLLGLGDDDAVREGFDRLRDVARGAGAPFTGVAVQPMATPGLELVIGAHRDEQFGPVVLFGLGGVFVETLRDVALRVAPVDDVDAREMLDEIAGSALLRGARGRPAVDRGALADALCRLGALMIAVPRIASVDLNPVIARADGVVAVDARVLLAAREDQPATGRTSASVNGAASPSGVTSR